MRVNCKHRFVFVSTRKACTHTIYQILDEHFSKGLVQLGFHRNLIPRKYLGFFRWTMVRNPYSRAVSIWWSGCRCHPEDRYGIRKGCGSGDDFKKFALWLPTTSEEQRIYEPLLMNQTEWLKPLEPITTIKVEHMEKELPLLPFWNPKIKIPKLNTTKSKIEDQSTKEGSHISRPSWQEMCSDEEIQKAIQQWAGSDFKKFKYSTEVR